MNYFKKAYEKIIEFYGVKHQKEKAIEELKELICEIEADAEGDYSEKQMVTEIADVLNMCDQLMIIYNINPHFVFKERMFKNERELDRINHKKELEANAKAWAGTDL